MCSFPELFFSQRFIWMIRLQTPHRPTPYPSPMSIWCHIGGHMHLLQNFAPPASSLLGTLPQITQPGCEASSLSPVLGKHRTLHPSLTGFQLSLERYSSAIIASWTPPLRLPPCPAPSFPLQMHPPPVPRCRQISRILLHMVRLHPGEKCKFANIEGIFEKSL